MSRASDLVTARIGGFPRVSGDEPWFQFSVVSFPWFSPRERG